MSSASAILKCFMRENRSNLPVQRARSCLRIWYFAAVRPAASGNVRPFSMRTGNTDCEDAVIKGRNQLSVDTEKFSCDYYQFLNGESSAINAFVGEFMTQYSWAEITTASLQGKMTEIIR